MKYYAQRKIALHFCMFQLFQPLDLIRLLTAIWFKTVEQSISYNTSHWPGKKEENALSEALYKVCLQ